MLSDDEIAFYVNTLRTWGFEIDDSDVIAVDRKGSEYSTISSYFRLSLKLDEITILYQLGTFNSYMLIINEKIETRDGYLVIYNYELTRDPEYIAYIDMFDKFIDILFKVVDDFSKPVGEELYYIINDKLGEQLALIDKK